MQMYKIEKNVPIPPAHTRGRKKGSSKYPVAQLKVSDSFVIPFDERRDVRGYMWFLANKHKVKLIVYRDHAANGWRVQRVE
jgi:hypothetical protein